MCIQVSFLVALSYLREGTLPDLTRNASVLPLAMACPCLVAKEGFAMQGLTTTTVGGWEYASYRTERWTPARWTTYSMRGA